MRVFISSTYNDLRIEREAAALALEELGHYAAGQEDRVPIYDRPLELCLEDIRSCDLLLFILAWRYGSNAPETGMSFVEAEYEEAVRAGIPHLALLLGKGSDWPDLHKDADLRNVHKLRARMAAQSHVFFDRNDCFRSVVYKNVADLWHPGRTTPTREVLKLHRHPPFGEGYLVQHEQVSEVFYRHGGCQFDRPYVFLTYVFEDAPEYFQDKMRYEILPMLCGSDFVHSIRLEIDTSSRRPSPVESIRSVLGRILSGQPSLSDVDIANSLRRFGRPFMLRIYLDERRFTLAILEDLLRYWEKFPDLTGDNNALFVFLNITGTRRSWKDMLVGRRSFWHRLQAVRRDYDERLALSVLRVLEPTDVSTFLQITLRQYIAMDPEEWKRVTADLPRFMPRKDLVPLMRRILQKTAGS